MDVLRWVSPSPRPPWAGCPGEVPRELILSAQQKFPFKQDQVSCWIVTKILQKSCFLFFDVALYWPWCFWGQVTKNCSYTEITEVLVHHCCYSWSFTHILCSWTLDTSFCVSWALQVSITQYWLSLIYVGNVAKPSPKPLKVLLHIQVYESKRWFLQFFYAFPTKDPSNPLMCSLPVPTRRFWCSSTCRGAALGNPCPVLFIPGRGNEETVDALRTRPFQGAR